MTFVQRVPLFIFVFIIFNLVMAVAPELVVPQIVPNPAPAISESAAPEPSAAAPAPEPTPAPATEAAPVADPAVPAPASPTPEATGEKPVPAPAPEDTNRVSLSIKPLFEVSLPSGKQWYPTMNDVLLLFAVIVLYIELIKSARAAGGSIVEHMLSMFVFCAFLVEFLVNKNAGTSAFLVVTMLALIDVVAGFMLASARSSLSGKV